MTIPEKFRCPLPLSAWKWVWKWCHPGTPMKRADLWEGTFALSVRPGRRTDNTRRMKGLLIGRYYDLESCILSELNLSSVSMMFYFNVLVVMVIHIVLILPLKKCKSRKVLPQASVAFMEVRRKWR